MPAQRILIVDDEAHIRNVMSSILARAGYEVAAADSVRQALDLVAAEQPFDIVLSDIMMAGADGLSPPEPLSPGHHGHRRPRHQRRHGCYPLRRI